ncbi:karyopherin (importin) beta 3 [Anaeramoeba flamelloides]|uniref:Karyopherin (Importin) beta 3 n=1 Tax=Anaeramoeba flamelloides TaxID=1746091 RepID=A0ABQ8X4X0_9EUKA|nr:karyopherin (importin) beta 3 [Anaeramoeba flamelloides]
MNQEFAQFEEIILLLLENDNEIRNQAELEFQNLYEQDPEACFQLLLACVEMSKEDAVKSLLLVLLRRAVVSSGSLYSKFSNKTKELIKNSLLEQLTNQKTRYIQKLICDVIIAIKIQPQKTNEWNDLLSIIFNIFENGNINLCELMMYILRELCLELKDDIIKYHEDLINYFRSFLSEKSEMKLRLSSLKTFLIYILIIPQEKQKQIIGILPATFDVIKGLIKEGDNDLANQCLQELVTTGRTSIDIFLNYYQELLDLCLGIVECEESKEDYLLQHISIEMLLMMIESAPGKALQTKGFLEKIVLIAFDLLCKIKEEDEINEWTNSGIIYFEPTPTNIGESILERISLRLGGNPLISISFSIIPDLLESKDWKLNYAGLKGIESISEGCKNEFEQDFEQLIGNILPFITNENYRVSYQALDALGQLTTDHTPLIQSFYTKKIMPLLIECLLVNNKYIQINSASVIIVFANQIPNSKMILHFLDKLLKILLEIIENSEDIPLQEQCMSALSSVLSACNGEIIGKYYKELIEFLKQIVISTNEKKEYKGIRGRTFECISTLANCIGKQTFNKDANEIFEYMITTQKSKDFSPHDPQFNFILKSWQKFALTFKESFEPYLEYLIPLLIESASQKLDSVVVNDDEDDEEKQRELIGRTIIISGKKKIGINTLSIQERFQSIELLYDLLCIIKMPLLPWIKKISKVIIPHLTFLFHDKIRQFSSQSLPIIVEILITSFENGNKEIDEQLINETVKENLFYLSITVTDEGILENLPFHLDAIATIISLSKNYINSKTLKPILELLPQLIKDSQNRKSENQLQFQNPNLYKLNYDEEDIDIQIEERMQNEELISQYLSETIEGLIKYHYDDFLPLFIKKLSNYYIDLAKKCSISFGRNATTVMSIVYYMNTKESATRQFFGAGVFAMRGKDSFAKVAQLISELLVQGIEKYGSGEEEQQKENINEKEYSSDEDEYDDEDGITTTMLVYDNAVSAIGKILYYQTDAIQFDVLAPFWLNCLPIQNDSDESKKNINYLCNWIEKENEIILGKNNKNLSKIIQIFVFVLDTDLVDENVTNKIIQILEKLNQQFSLKDWKLLIDNWQNNDLIEKFSELLNNFEKN